MRKYTSIPALVVLLVLTAGIAMGDDDAKQKKAGFKGKGQLAGKLFEKLDANGDGKISKEEFAKFGAKFGKGKGGAGKAGKGKGKLFEKLDGDGDGFLSKAEFKKAASMAGKGGNLKKFGKKNKVE